MSYCKKLSEDEPISKSARRFKSRRECEITLLDYKKEALLKRRKKPPVIAKRKMRKVSERAEELMKKRSFPKEVRDAIANDRKGC
jgi:hypothetical protein